jgi:hypothetical protein
MAGRRGAPLDGVDADVDPLTSERRRAGRPSADRFAPLPSIAIAALCRTAGVDGADGTRLTMAANWAFAGARGAASAPRAPGGALPGAGGDERHDGLVEPLGGVAWDDQHRGLMRRAGWAGVGAEHHAP